MWINEKTLGVFILHADIRYECWKEGNVLPGVLDDEILAQHGYALLTQNKPAFDPVTQKLQPSSPIKTEFGWTQDFYIVSLDDVTIANNKNQKTVEKIQSIEGQISYGYIQAARYLVDGDTVKLEEWKVKVNELKLEMEALKITLPSNQEA